VAGGDEQFEVIILGDDQGLLRGSGQASIAFVQVIADAGIGS